MSMGVIAKMAEVVLVFEEALDRRAFDIFNLFRLRGFTYQFAFSEDSIVQRNLYPGSISYEHSVAGLKKLLSSHPNKFFIYIPLLEESLDWFYQVKGEFGDRLKYLLPTQQQFSILRDKSLLSMWASQFHCVPEPFSYEMLCEEAFWIEGRCVMAKPSCGRGSRGLRVLHSAEEARAFHCNESYVYQSFIGDGKSVIGVSVLSVDGKVLASYQHRRIRTYPESGGVSTCAELCYETSLDKLVTTMLQEMKVSGLLMFEFLRDNQGQWKLIECNPRLWGTVALGEFAGYSLLEKYIAFCTDTEVISHSILTDTKIRWMFPYEYLWVIKGGITRLNSLYPKANEFQVGFTGAGMRFVLYIFFSLFDLKKWKTFLRKFRQQ